MRKRLLNFAICGFVALWAGCSSSTGPTAASGIGTWHITVNRLVFVSSTFTDTIDVRPAPFALVVTDTGAASSAMFPNIYGLDAEADTVIRWGLGSATTISVTGDSIKVLFDNGNESCMLGIAGTFHGTSASGVGGVSCADSTISGGSWSATKS